MVPSNYQVRRATVDDLVVLRRLWDQVGLPSAELEKRLTEFQVAESAVGEVFGTLGLQIVGTQGRIHSEAYQASEWADELQPRLWERVLTLARQHGVYRLWVPNEASLFWLEQGFELAGSELTKKLPPAFWLDREVSWLTFPLREESAAAISVEQEWILFRQSQQAANDHRLRHARALRIVAVIVTIGALILVVLAIGFLVLKRGGRR